MRQMARTFMPASNLLEGGGHTKGIFNTALVADNVQQLTKEVYGPVLSATDIANIKEVWPPSPPVSNLRWPVNPTALSALRDLLRLRYMVMNGSRRRFYSNFSEEWKRILKMALISEGM